MEAEEEPKQRGGRLFKKGEINNPKGRGKGVQNVVTTQMRETMYNFYMGNIDTLQSDFDAMEPKDRVTLRVKLLPFFMPTMTATKSEKTIKHTGYEHLGSKELLLKLSQTIKIPKDAAEDTEFTEG